MGNDKLWNRPPNDKFYVPLYVKCIELDIPFCTQVGHTGPLMPSETGRPVPYLDEVALTWKHEDVFIDTSAYLPRYYPPQLLQYMKSYGQDKALFGTNFPQLALDKAVQPVEALGLAEAVKAKFLFQNAQRVFKL